MSISTKVFRLLNISHNCRKVLLTQECNIHRWVMPTLKELKRRAVKHSSIIPKLPNHRNTYLEWNQEVELYAFGKRLKEDFDPTLLRVAFTHRSFIIQEEMKQKALGIENPEIKQQDNKKLSEEGESFISDYIEAYLKVALPKFPLEGIAHIKNYLLCRETLAIVAAGLGCKDLILSDEYPVSENLLAQTFQAIVAALIHSSGVEHGAHFVRDFVITQLHGKDVNDLWPIENPLEMLEKLMEKAGMKKPELRLIGQSAKNTILACYRVGIYVDKEMLCAGFGENISMAKEMAAREGLKIFFGTQENMPPINFKIKGLPKEDLKQQYLQTS